MIKKKHIGIFIPLALLLILACQGSRASKSNLQPKANDPGFPSVLTDSPSGAFTEADFARHVAALKKKLPSPEFSLVIQRPFVWRCANHSLRVLLEQRQCPDHEYRDGRRHVGA